MKKILLLAALAILIAGCGKHIIGINPSVSSASNSYDSLDISSWKFFSCKNQELEFRNCEIQFLMPLNTNMEFFLKLLTISYHDFSYGEEEWNKGLPGLSKKWFNFVVSNVSEYQNINLQSIPNTFNFNDKKISKNDRVKYIEQKKNFSIMRYEFDLAKSEIFVVRTKDHTYFILPGSGITPYGMNMIETILLNSKVNE
jgi:hypothetical protein